MIRGSPQEAITGPGSPTKRLLVGWDMTIREAAKQWARVGLGLVYPPELRVLQFGCRGRSRRFAAALRTLSIEPGTCRVAVLPKVRNTVSWRGRSIQRMCSVQGQ